MAANQTRIEVPGLAQLRADLKQLPKDVQKVLPREMKKVAEIVVADARGRVPSRTGTAAAGIRASGTSTGAGVRESKSVRYLQWLDFGSRNPRTGNARAEGPWRGSGAGPTGGRFVYPAIEAKRAQIIAAADAAVATAAREAGFK